MIFFKKPAVIAAIIIVLIAIIWGGYKIFGKSELPYEFVVVQKESLTQEVSITGHVKPAESVDLAFEKSGKVKLANINVGDEVFAGQTLAVLENADYYAQLAQAEATVKSQQAKLDELKLGTRKEEIEAKEAELKKAEQDLANYYSGISSILGEAYNDADDAVRKQTDEIFSNDETAPQISFSVSDSQVKLNAEFDRAALTTDLNNWKNQLNQINANSSFVELDDKLQKSKIYLAKINSFLSETMDAVLNSTNLSQTNITTYKANINTARTNINASLTNVSDQEQAILSQKLTVQKIKSELDLKLAGTLPEQITAQEAKVAEAEANALNYKAQIAKTVIYAPFGGIITKQDAKVGEVVAANAAVISLISESQFEIKANIPEVDIAKVKIGDLAKITLDAYGNGVVFQAKVTAIDPAETIIEGVATYKTTFQFLGKDGRIKSGMTANIDIVTAELDGVIAVPQRAVTEKNGSKTVQIIENGNVKEVNVKTGIRGSDGKIEIISGLKEGDKVIVSKK